MTGRRVTLPDEIRRVYTTAPPVGLVVYALAPTTLLGWNFPPFLPLPGDAEALVAPAARGLPVFGNMMGHGQQTNMEQVIALKPDLAVAWSNPLLDGAALEKRFAEAKIPLVVLKLDSLEDYPRAFELMGEVLGDPARGAELAAYVRGALDRLDALARRLPERRVKVYYAESADGLATDCDSSIHSEAIRRAGGDNIHRCRQAQLVGMERVSLEEIAAAAPDLIVAQERAFGEAAAAPRWRAVRAAAEGHVLFVPRAPFNWIDRPPGFMQALGTQWLANAFYPDLYPLDVEAEARRFYKLFLHVDIDGARAARLLQ